MRYILMLFILIISNTVSQLFDVVTLGNGELLETQL
jgi:hypothetical protein